MVFIDEYKFLLYIYIIIRREYIIPQDELYTQVYFDENLLHQRIEFVIIKNILTAEGNINEILNEQSGLFGGNE